MENKFTTKEKYLAYRSAWKAEYKREFESKQLTPLEKSDIFMSS
jgi:hypothetical protein